MNSETARHSPLPLPPPDFEVEEADAQRTGQQLIMAAELAEMGIHLARAAFIPATKNPSDAADAAYDRIARAVERALALEAWLLRLRRARSAQHAARKAHADQQAHASQTRQLRENLEQAVAATPDFSRAQRFRLERYMRDFTASGEPTRPIPEILAEICRQLGITPNSAAPSKPPSPPLYRMGEPHQSSPTAGPMPTLNVRPPPPD